MIILVTTKSEVQAIIAENPSSFALQSITVNGHSLASNITVSASDVGLGNVDNTSDANKPVSTATQTALNLKANLASPTFTGTVAGITATMVGLGNVSNNAQLTIANNLSDLNNAGTARTNLGLGSLATQSGTFSGTSSGTNTGDQVISDATISTTDITTNNFTTAKHGFVPKGTNTGKFLKDDGTWGTPTDAVAVWGSITGTLSSQSDLQSALDAKQPLDSDLTTIAGLTATTDNFMVATASAWASRTPTQARTQIGLGNVDNTSDASKPVSTAQATAIGLKVTANVAITGATKTKVTYDAKGLVTSGADATTADIADSSDKRYVTDAQLVVIGNTSGTNTGDQTSIVGITGTLAQFNTALTGADFATGGGTVTGASSGTNTGDQTTIVGITGTKAQFDTAVTDGNILYVGDITQYTDEMAQDAIGAMVSTAFTYTDSTPLLALTARTIGGVSYDGTANITVATATGGFTVSGGALALGANSITMSGSIGVTGTRVTKGWFTDLEVTNSIVGSITGNSATVTTNANLTGHITSTGNATVLGSFTVAQLNTAISDGDVATGGGTATGTNTGDQTGGTPALVFGTANTAGVSTNFIRRDDTILAFDATAPSTQAFGDSAVVGVATTTARRDHKHAMMSAPTTITGNAGTATALQNARNIGGVSFNGTADITVATATGGFTISGGDLALGANNITMSGSLGSTGTRLTKGWFTDLQVTNAIAGSVTGNAGTVTTNANLTGVVTSVGNATAIADGALSIAKTSGLQTALDAKQATLVSGTNIKTVNGSSLLGSGDLITTPSMNLNILVGIADITITAGYSAYVSDFFEMADGFYMDVLSGGMMESG